MISLHTLSLRHSALYRELTSFPTRRSSDLTQTRRSTSSSSESLSACSRVGTTPSMVFCAKVLAMKDLAQKTIDGVVPTLDRKSTRLNSSHRCISYAVFCLKKKKKIKPNQHH